MPKQLYKITQFHGGLNSNSDARDIAENELSEATDAMVDELGKIRLMGGNTAHSTMAARANQISPGYGLFQFSHDRIDGHTASTGTEVGADYMAFSEPDTAGTVDIYSAQDNGYQSPITGMDNNTGGLRKDVFFAADGALRVCDSEFGNTNDSKWWGYINRNTFKYSGAGSDGSATYNSWSLQDQEISPPAAGAHVASSLAPSAINQLDMYITQTNGGSGKGWYGGGATALTARNFDVAYTFIYDGIQESPLFEFTDIATFPINQPPAGIGNSIVTVNVTALAGAWNPRITGARIYINQTYPQGVEGWIFLSEIDMNYGQRSKFGEGSWHNWTYNSGSARPEITKVVCVADSGDSLNQKYFTIYTATGKTQIWIDTDDSGTSAPSSSGYADVIEVTQIGTDDSANSVAIAIASAINEDGAPMTASVSGSTIIITDNASAARTDASDVNTGFAISTISTGIASGGAGYYRCSSPPMNVEPVGIPFQTITGFGEEVTSVGARYKTAVTANRRTYIGNIYQNDITGVLQQKGDAILKSPINQFDVFPQDSVLEASVNDGDEIMKLETYADRILQFKKTKLQLINISKEIEFLEDTFMHKGVSHTAATCKTDFGIAWVNRQGCYLYDGQKITNLLEKQGRQIIKESDWDSFTTDNSIIGYVPKKRQLIVLKDCTATSDGDIYLLDIVTQSWVKGNSKFADAEIQTNFVTDWNGDLVHVYDSDVGTVHKWDDNPAASAAVDIRTKDIDFGNPGQDKRIYKFYVTHRGSASNIQLSYGINGEQDSSDFTSAGSELPVTSAVTDWVTTAITPTAFSCKSVRLRLFSQSTTTPANFEINDITIVFRLKGMR
tara:strand:- start:658 stop:3186 length:2529 start_codon:yes stop_codon:yes gene_type:complete